MAKKQQSNVDLWLERETPHTRKALENASRYFDANDKLTVNTLEAVYGQESSFGTRQHQRGSAGVAGHFHLEPDTAKRYGLSVSKKNDQRFNIDYASSAAARYLKDLNTFFGKTTVFSEGSATIPVKSIVEREKFVLGAYNGGEGRIAGTQRLAEKAGKNLQLWNDVKQYLESAGDDKAKAEETKHYVEVVPVYENEFAQKSLADKKLKQKEIRKWKYRCTEGHWVTIGGRPVFICD